jgi:outer membrane protein OmpA-like peptidoglycan-associated protein
LHSCFMKKIFVFKKTVFIFLLFICFVRIVSAQQIKDTMLIVYFDNNSFELNTDEQQKLQSFFSNHKLLSVQSIYGYADSVGTEKNNLILSSKRIQTAISFIKKYLPVNSNSSINNFGESNPASSNDLALNRRVVIKCKIDDNEVRAKTENNTSAIIRKIVLDKLYFKPDIPVLESFSLDYLKRIAAELKNYPDAKFEIRGHVNCSLNTPENSGYMKTMNKLSEDRAKTVFDFLKDYGIPENKMTYKGMGNKQMIYPDARTDDEKRQNMRVEIFIIDQN